jgi:hypothetical protein
MKRFRFESEGGLGNRTSPAEHPRTADPIPISESVMVSWARRVADCRAAGIHRPVKLTDALIARRRSSMDSPSSPRTTTTTRKR